MSETLSAEKTRMTVTIMTEKKEAVKTLWCLVAVASLT